VIINAKFIVVLFSFWAPQDSHRAPPLDPTGGLPSLEPLNYNLWLLAIPLVKNLVNRTI